MNQEKIGKFIAECRKKQKLTQEGLAERLNLTSKAVSKWECGKRLPDASIMMDLCVILEITVNDLLSGEKVDKNKYIDVADGNLIKIKQQEEKFKKELKIIQNCFIALSIILGIIALIIFCVHLYMNYTNFENYNGTLFDTLFPIDIVLALLFGFISYIINFREKYMIIERK